MDTLRALLHRHMPSILLTLHLKDWTPDTAGMACCQTDERVLTNWEEEEEEEEEGMTGDTGS